MKYLSILVLFTFTSVAYSHGGGLDRYGCHNETKTGGYHCHRSSGWGGSISGSGLNLNQFEDKVTNSWEDAEFYEGEIKIKNFACHSRSGLKMELVNKSSNDYMISFKIVMKDNDKDPILNWSDTIFVQSMSRTPTSYRLTDQQTREQFAERLFSGNLDNALYGTYTCPSNIHYRSVVEISRVKS